MSDLDMTLDEKLRAMKAEVVKARAAEQTAQRNLTQARQFLVKAERDASLAFDKARCAEHRKDSFEQLLDD